jgi:hypothetical protein
MASFADLPLDVVRLIVDQITTSTQLKGDTKQLDSLVVWCRLASVCRR